MTAQLESPAESLLKLAQCLMIDRAKLAEHEQIDDLLFREEMFPAEHIRQINLEILNALFAAYGNTLQFSVAVGDMVLLQLNKPLEAPDLSQFLLDVNESPFVTLDIKLNKHLLLNNWGVAAPNANIHIFFFPEALTRILQRDLLELDTTLFKGENESSKMIILIPESDFVLNGDYLAVIGHPGIHNWAQYAPSVSPDSAKLEKLREAALTNLHWVGFTFKYLTPLHMTVRSETPSRDPASMIPTLIYTHLATLSIFYTANQTRHKEQQSTHEWRAMYIAEGYEAEILLTQLVRDVSNNQDLTQALPDAALVLSETAVWAYDSRQSGSDCIIVAQRIMAHELRGGNPKDNYRRLITMAPHLSKEVKWGWAAFIEGKLDKYFTQVHDLEQVVAATTNSVAAQIEGLTKALIDNMLAAVGVLVATFLAATFKDQFNANVFRMGMLAYAVYLIAFPLGIGLLSSQDRFKSIRDMFDKQTQDFTNRLSQDQVREIVGKTVDAVEGKFRKWLHITAGGYIVVAGLVIVGCLIVPSFATINPLASPVATAISQPTLTSTVTPSANMNTSSPISTP